MTKPRTKSASSTDSSPTAPETALGAPEEAAATAPDEPEAAAEATAPPAPEAGAAEQAPPEAAAAAEVEGIGVEDTQRLARGVEAARLLEAAAERVRRARRRAKRAKKGDARLNARTQLKKLRRRLQEVQETVLSRGIDDEEHHTLAALLHALDRALDEFRDGKPKRKALRRIARAAKTTRKSL